MWSCDFNDFLRNYDVSSTRDPIAGNPHSAHFIIKIRVPTGLVYALPHQDSKAWTAEPAVKALSSCSSGLKAWTAERAEKTRSTRRLFVCRLAANARPISSSLRAPRKLGVLRGESFKLFRQGLKARTAELRGSSSCSHSIANRYPSVSQRIGSFAVPAV